MKKENIELLNRIKPAIEKIIADECSNIYTEYEELKKKIQLLEQTIKKLEKENSSKEKNINHCNNYISRLNEFIWLMVADWICELINDWGWDEFWWYHVQFWKYKDQQIELFYESF